MGDGTCLWTRVQIPAPPPLRKMKIKRLFISFVSLSIVSISFVDVLFSQLYDESNKIVYIQTIKKKIEEIKQIVPNVKNPVKELTQIAHLYIEIEEYDNAIGYILKAISIEPQNPNLYYTLALIYEKKNDKEKAIESWKNVLKFSKNKKLSDIALKHIEVLQSQK